MLRVDGRVPDAADERGHEARVRGELPVDGGGGGDGGAVRDQRGGVRERAVAPPRARGRPCLGLGGVGGRGGVGRRGRRGGGWRRVEAAADEPVDERGGQGRVVEELALPGDVGRADEAAGGDEDERGDEVREVRGEVGGLKVIHHMSVALYF